MVEELRDSGFNGHVIILSGYSDFEYARKAMRLKDKRLPFKTSFKSHNRRSINEDNFATRRKIYRRDEAL